MPSFIALEEQLQLNLLSFFQGQDQLAPRTGLITETLLGREMKVHDKRQNHSAQQQPSASSCKRKQQQQQRQSQLHNTKFSRSQRLVLQVPLLAFKQ